MVSMLIYSSSDRELHSIKSVTTDLAAYLSEDKWEIATFSSLGEMRAFLDKKPLVNMACYDVVPKGSIDFLSEARRQYKDTLLMLIADSTMNPMDYVRPDILASSLIIRPFKAEQLKEKLKDLVTAHISRVMEEGDDKAFTVESREGRTRIPYSQIYYMEAREKKIFLRLQNKEVPFSGTIEELEETLPDTFIRCHRSFIVNEMYIEKIMLSQSEIELAHGMSVPLSRSYKPRFKSLR